MAFICVVGCLGLFKGQSGVLGINLPGGTAALLKLTTGSSGSAPMQAHGSTPLATRKRKEYLDLQNGHLNGPYTAYTLCFGI